MHGPAVPVSSHLTVVQEFAILDAFDALGALPCKVGCLQFRTVHALCFSRIHVLAGLVCVHLCPLEALCDGGSAWLQLPCQTTKAGESGSTTLVLSSSSVLHGMLGSSCPVKQPLRAGLHHNLCGRLKQLSHAGLMCASKYLLWRQRANNFFCTMQAEALFLPVTLLLLALVFTIAVTVPGAIRAG